MSRRVLFRPEAEAEALESRLWYEARRPGLGDEFGAAVALAVDRIVDHPGAYPRVSAGIRRAVLSRFPYAIYFRVLDDDIVILAVHGRQHPRRWLARR